MRTSSDTLRAAIASAKRSPEPSNSAPVGDSQPVEAGKSSTHGSTEKSADTSTCDDCDYEFIVSATERHPVAIICNKHDWYGAIL